MITFPLEFLPIKHLNHGYHLGRQPVTVDIIVCILDLWFKYEVYIVRINNLLR